MTQSQRDKLFSFVPVPEQATFLRAHLGPPLKAHASSRSLTRHPSHVGSSWCLSARGLFEYAIRSTLLLQAWLVLSRGPTGSGPGELQATNSGPFLQRSLVPGPFIHSCLQPTEVALLTLSFPHAGIGQVTLRGEATWVSYVVSYAHRKEGSFLHPGWPI